jgi:hypothetical protein
MTTLCEEALATPSERLLRVGQEHPEVGDAYAEAYAALLACRERGSFAYATLCRHGLTILGARVPSASTQFVGLDDPRQVLFDQIMIVSASSFAGAALVANTGTRVAIMAGRDDFYAHVARHAFSAWYGPPPLESEHEVAELRTSTSTVGQSLVECISIEEEALAAMDDASADYRSRRASARAEERRLRRYDRE